MFIFPFDIDYSGGIQADFKYRMVSLPHSQVLVILFDIYGACLAHSDWASARLPFCNRVSLILFNDSTLQLLSKQALTESCAIILHTCD